MGYDETQSLRDRVDQLEREVTEREEHEYQQQRRRREEREQQRREDQRYADDWPEAFQKQEHLFHEQIRCCRKDFPEEIPYWEECLRINSLARELYQEGWAAIEEEMQRKRKALLEAVATRVEEQYPETELMQDLRTDDLYEYLYW